MMSQSLLPPPPGGQSVEEAALKLQQLTDKLNKVTSKQSNLQSDPKWANTDKSDWTRSYAFWSDWEDTEELRQEKDREEQKFRKMMVEQQADFLGHSHDHSEERKFFELPETEKMGYCERHRIKGNYLFQEGIYPKAAEQYQLALSYYEYCFPEGDLLQRNLDELRRVCLCNISLCFYRMGYWRQAIQAATQVLQEDQYHCKALYRRAQAYLALDEYSLALDDLKKALELNPTDVYVQREIVALKGQKSLAHVAEQVLATAILGLDINKDNDKEQVLTNNNRREQSCVESETPHMGSSGKITGSNPRIFTADPPPDFYELTSLLEPCVPDGLF